MGDWIEWDQLFGCFVCVIDGECDVEVMEDCFCVLIFFVEEVGGLVFQLFGQFGIWWMCLFVFIEYFIKE